MSEGFDVRTDIRTDIPTPKRSFYTRYGKRMLDILFSGLAILVLSPVILTLVICELIFHGRPVFYKHKRPGKDGKIFEMYKFRSMLNETERDGVYLSPAERITKFGRILRRTSLDELGGLFNVFGGTMSIIGPRPLMVDYLPLYNQRHAYRHAVRPGLACWKLGSGNKLEASSWTWNVQFENDIWYVENVSLWIDIKMVVKTFAVVFSKSEMRTESNRIKFDGKNLLETRTKKQVLADLAAEEEAKKADEAAAKEN